MVRWILAAVALSCSSRCPSAAGAGHPALRRLPTARLQPTGALAPGDTPAGAPPHGARLAPRAARAVPLLVDLPARGAVSGDSTTRVSLPRAPTPRTSPPPPPRASRSGLLRDEDTAFPVHARYTTSSLWLHSMRTLPASSVLRGVRAPVLASVVWSALLAALHAVTHFHVPCSRPHTLLSWALALLLVFRTNSSYNRFWEGRKIWEKLLNRCRDLVRTCTVYRDAISLRRLRRIACLITILPRVLRSHVQVRPFADEQSLSTRDISACLLPYDKMVLARVRNKPLFIANTLAREIRAIPTSDALDFSSRERLFLLAMVNDLSACIGACERIVQTPVPTQYARHTSRFLCLWIFTLPLLLLPEMGFWVVPAIACISWVLFGIQELGLQIENPFESILKLDILEGMNQQSVDETLSLAGDYAEIALREDGELAPRP